MEVCWAEVMSCRQTQRAGVIHRLHMNESRWETKDIKESSPRKLVVLKTRDGHYVNSKPTMYTTLSQSALDFSHFLNKVSIQMDRNVKCYYQKLLNCTVYYRSRHINWTVAGAWCIYFKDRICKNIIFYSYCIKSVEAAGTQHKYFLCKNDCIQTPEIDINLLLWATTGLCCILNNYEVFCMEGGNTAVCGVT